MITTNRQCHTKRIFLLVALYTCAYSGWALSEVSLQADIKKSREMFSADSPQWLAAVGKLQVPGIKYEQGQQRNHREACSATLIGSRGSTQANTIITAWHCLEFYEDLSKAILFTLKNGTQHSFSSEARVLAHGGGMHADWAILRLQKPVPASKFTPLELKSTGVDTLRPITMAGYSNDGENSGYGQRLSYHFSCNVLPSPIANNRASNCIAMKGASGGAVTQISADGRIELAGVISRGNSSDFSEYVPVEMFRLTALAHL
ncbi:MAG: V8-like Glu-specific endopeptidase [Halioglobus sp.]